MIGKIIGAIVGLFAGGPPGVLTGLLLGHMFDSTMAGGSSKSRQRGRAYTNNQGSGDFAVSFVALTAVVLKADGRVLRSELNFVKEFINKQFSPQERPSVLKLLKAALDRNYDLETICADIRNYMDLSSRSQLLYYLLGVAEADGYISEVEDRTIQHIAHYLRIPKGSYMSMRAMFGNPRSSRSRQQSSNRATRARTSISNDYAVLGLDAKCTDDAVKKAYRSLAKQYHPDNSDT